eukprot:TRINITY_DN27765_c0_g1_i1.p1 TRINITY_DN27765_c0_g1~~TRINITY_DN27765_c0_g1_i1.p1  ORF type:complete len:373 (+),score=53.29 TRINITY_DN27765_c0_g1_i1:152-1120(+)
MEEFPQDEEMQHVATQCILNLAQGSAQGHRRLVHTGGCELIVAMLQDFPDKARLVIGGLDALAVLAGARGEAQARLLNAGSVPLILGLMRKFSRDRDILSKGLRCMINLLCENADAQQEMLTEGAADVIADIMRRFPLDAEMQIYSAGGIVNLCRDNPEGSNHFVRNGLCNLAVFAMVTYSETPEVLLPAAQAVLSLSNSPHNTAQSQLVSAGACEAVVDMLRNFPEERNFQLCGCRAVVQLTRDNAEGQQRFLAGRTTQLVAAAMRAFIGDREVQRDGCEAFAHLEARPAGVDLHNIVESTAPGTRKNAQRREPPNEQTLS